MKKEKISQDRRDYAMRTALATVRLEGLEPDQDAKNLAAKASNTLPISTKPKPTLLTCEFRNSKPLPCQAISTWIT